MFSHQLRSTRLLAVPLILALMVAGLVWTPEAAARRARTSGAGGCGQFRDVVGAAVDGDAIVVMVDPSDPEFGRNSESATITTTLLLEGGWLPPPGGCAAAGNVVFNSEAAFVDAGFTFTAPAQRGGLFNFGEPVVTLAPTVKNLDVLHVFFEPQGGVTGDGGGVSGPALNGARLRFENVIFRNDEGDTPDVSGRGGGLFLAIDGGSNVTIRNSRFSGLRAESGGGFEIDVRGDSTLTLDRVTVTNNTADGAGGGGGGRIRLFSGTVIIRDSVFSGNGAPAGAGGGLRIERPAGATGKSEVWLINTVIAGNNASSGANLSQSGSGLTMYQVNRAGFLPLVTGASGPAAAITGITRTGNTYNVAFTTSGFTPQMSGLHVHFFFDTVPPDQAGVPADPAGWYMYAGSSPFTGFNLRDRPFGATQMCILVANPDHSVIPNTGNCGALP